MPLSLNIQRLHKALALEIKSKITIFKALYLDLLPKEIKERKEIPV